MGGVFPSTESSPALVSGLHCKTRKETQNSHSTFCFIIASLIYYSRRYDSLGNIVDGPIGSDLVRNRQFGTAKIGNLAVPPPKRVMQTWLVAFVCKEI